MKIQWIGTIVLALGLAANGLAQDEWKASKEGPQGTAELPSLHAKTPEPASTQEEPKKDQKPSKTPEAEENGSVVPASEWNEPADMLGGFYGSADYILWWLKKGAAFP